MLVVSDPATGPRQGGIVLPCGTTPATPDNKLAFDFRGMEHQRLCLLNPSSHWTNPIGLPWDLPRLHWLGLEVFPFPIKNLPEPVGLSPEISLARGTFPASSWGGNRNLAAPEPRRPWPTPSQPNPRDPDNPPSLPRRPRTSSLRGCSELRQWWAASGWEAGLGGAGPLPAIRTIPSNFSGSPVLPEPMNEGDARCRSLNPLLTPTSCGWPPHHRPGFPPKHSLFAPPPPMLAKLRDLPLFPLGGATNILFY
jgi:hypothetical protein